MDTGLDTPSHRLVSRCWRWIRACDKGYLAPYSPKIGPDEDFILNVKKAFLTNFFLKKSETYVVTHQTICLEE